MKSKLYLILIISFLIRLILLIVDQFWFRLPQSGIDTENFDIWAYNIYIYSPHTFLETLSDGAKLFSTYGALIYSFFGRTPFIWAFTMILFGVGTVRNVYNATLLITENYKYAAKSAWIICFFPNIAVLSVLVLREAPIHYFLSLSAVYLIKYIKYKKLSSFFLFFFYSLLSTLLHSALISIFIGFIFLLLLSNQKVKISIKIFFVLIILSGLLIIDSTGIGLSKFGGSFSNAIELLQMGLNYSDTGAVYPDWLILKGGFSEIWKIPIRVLAFLFAPFFPFLVRNTSHFIGFIDGLFYFIIFLAYLLKRKVIMKNKMSKSLLYIILAISLAFSLGSSNFGTNIRHRAKILPLMIMIIYSKKIE